MGELTVHLLHSFVHSNQSRCLQASNKAWLLGVPLAKTHKACLDLSLPSCTHGNVAQILEELYGVVVPAGLLGRNKCVYLTPCLRFSLSQRGEMPLASLSGFLFPPGPLLGSALGLSLRVLSIDYADNDQR
jgi:hypothetical protein